MIHVTVLAVKSITRSKFLDELERRLINIHGADNFQMVRHLCGHDYWDRWRKASNLITWGIKWTNERYRQETGLYPKGKNTLYVENGLFDQSRGLYVDHRGYFGGSSMVVEGTNKTAPTEKQRQFLHNFTKRSWSHEFGSDCDPNGPILVALQTNNDAPMQHFFPGGENAPRGRGERKRAFLEQCKEYLPKGREVIVRLHPRDPEGRELPKGFEMPSNWRLDDMKTRIYPMLRKSSALVCVNSTVATEAMTLNLPIATLGYGSFKGTGASYDCAMMPRRMNGILEVKPNMEAREAYLCQILKDHQCAYSGKNIPLFLDRSRSIEYWIDNLHHVDAAPTYRRIIAEDRKDAPAAPKQETKTEAETMPKPARRGKRKKNKRKPRALKVCLHCGNDTPDTGCPSCKCIHCKKGNC